MWELDFSFLCIRIFFQSFLQKISILLQKFNILIASNDNWQLIKIQNHHEIGLRDLLLAVLCHASEIELQSFKLL